MSNEGGISYEFLTFSVRRRGFLPRERSVGMVGYCGFLGKFEGDLDFLLVVFLRNLLSLVTRGAHTLLFNYCSRVF
jgi:hypothetical protein